MKLAIILFIVTYIFIFMLSDYKHIVGLISALLFIILGILPINKVLTSIDFNVLLMIFGIMGTVNLFIDSKMPEKVSDFIIDITPNVKWMTIALALFAGIVSAFIDNVATVLMIAPIALQIAKKANVSPVPILIVISLFSNLEGAATLVGDTTSILLAGASNMNFIDFFIYNNKMGLFFIVQFSLIACTVALYYIFRNENKKITKEIDCKVEDYFPSFLLFGTIFTLIVISFIPNKISIANGIVCMLFYIIGIVRNMIKVKSKKGIFNYLFGKKPKDVLIENIKNIDYKTLLLLTSLFIIIGGVKEAGIIDALSNTFLRLSSDTFVLYSCIVLFSCLISAFIDNIPYVATMLPVVSTLSLKLGIEPTVLYYGLIIGATLGGNLTPVGASANIASIGILNKNGYSVSTNEYVKLSIPITVIAVGTGYLITYLLYF